MTSAALLSAAVGTVYFRITLAYIAAVTGVLRGEPVMKLFKKRTLCAALNL